MGEDYPFGYTGMRVGPSVDRARMVQQRRDYQRSGGYGVAPSYADYNLRFASHNGRSLINPNTVFVGTAGYPDRFGGFDFDGLTGWVQRRRGRLLRRGLLRGPGMGAIQYGAMPWYLSDQTRQPKWYDYGGGSLKFDGVGSRAKLISI